VTKKKVLYDVSGRLSAIFVDDGQWHTVKVQRYGSVAILTLDGGEGRRYNDSFVFSGHQMMTVDKQVSIFYKRLLLGGKIPFA
jgi:hypothetical protein